MKLEDSIIVSTHAVFMKEQSIVTEQHYLWSYEITIMNNSDEIVQLLNRYWKITDGYGKTEEIRGPGVVGLQPIIKPGKAFVYNSFCQLMTSHGSMKGYYEMQNLNEVRFKVKIPRFVLASAASVLH